MRRGFALCLLAFLVGSVWAATLPEGVVRQLERAEEAYRQGRYEEAFQIYRELESSGLGGWALFYNEGNAAFRAGHLGWAVYAYERARRERPRDPDIRYNYAQARKILGWEGGEGARTGLARLEEVVLSAYSLEDVLRAGLGLLWVGSVLLGVYLLRPRQATGRRWIPRGLAVLALLWLVALGIKWWERERLPDGVLLEAASVRSAPQEDGVEITSLTEGTFVNTRRRLGDWWEVRVGSEIQGWVRSDVLGLF
jgi:tetratricopeptide (TPR) repeat protein